MGFGDPWPAISRSFEGLMSDKTPSPTQLLFLAFLAVKRKSFFRGKKAVRGLARIALSLLYPARHPLSSFLFVFALFKHCALGLASFFRGARGLWIPMGMGCSYALLSLAFFVATGPQGLPGFSSFSSFAVQRLAPESFLAAKPDMRAGICSDGSIGRIGAKSCQNPSRVLGDARALFSDAAQIYRNPSRASNAATPALLLSRQFLARRAEATRSFMKDCAEPFVIAFLLLSSAWGCWRLIFNQSSRQAYYAQWGAAQEQAALIPAIILMMALFFGGQALIAGAIIGAQRQPFWPWLQTQSIVHSPVFTLPLAKARGSDQLILMATPYDQTWASPPNNFLAVFTNDPEQRGVLALGDWRPEEIVSSRAGALLLARAPHLDAVERAAALAEFSAAREDSMDPLRVWSASMPLAGLLAIGFLLLLAFGAFLRSLFKTGKQQIVRLAAEGAQESLALHEAKVLGQALRGDEALISSSDAQPRRQKKIHRL